jgi:acyl-CoA synthetase (AMP-forming)/AMP-acid ligase II
MKTDGSPNNSEGNGLPRTRESPEAVEGLQDALHHCPAVGEGLDINPWHDLLYDRLRDRALPALITDGTITPAASLWTGSRLWTDAFRAAGLRAGDRLVIALPPSTAFVQVLVAALWEGLTIALASPDDDIEALLRQLDARAAVALQPGPHAWGSDEYTGPSSTPDSLRSVKTERTPDVRFLLRTSGTTQPARWIALSDRNVLSVLASHLPHFTLQNARVLSVLPWAHAFGLVLDLFPALLAGSEIVRAPDGGRDASGLVGLADAWDATHLSAVPLTIQRLLDYERGPSLLKRLNGGIVGGAPVSGPLADRLAQTRLRVGYGQTEAAPGIALGAPGRWAANYLGRPVGCTVEVAEDGELLFEGPNACIGVWQDGTLDRADPNRTVHTGDLVSRDGKDLFFQGRKDMAFKLSNGRLVQAGTLEAQLKGAHPSLRDVLLFTPNGDDVAVALCSDAPPSELPSQEQLQSALGSLGAKLRWSTAVPPEDWVMEAKGTVDRTTMTHVLTEHHLSR